MTTRYIYAYNGSGLPMTCEVEVLDNDGEKAWISFPDFVPPVDQVAVEAGVDQVVSENSRIVRAKCLTTERHPDPASFNWLD